MLISLDYLILKYNIILNGVIHVGAHECEEITLYEKYIDRNKILWIEGLENKVLLNKSKYKNLLIENAVVSDIEETVKFNISSNGQSSSILEFGLHKQFHSDITFIDTVYVNTKLLKNILINYNIPFNFINLDIQGVELKALKGMENYLNQIQYIYTEVNSDYVYENCCLIEEIDLFLSKYNFIRVETEWCGENKWGDAFYIKN